MIKTTKILHDELKDYSNINNKISRMVKQGELFPLVKGIYLTEKDVSAHCLAECICGPSYISFEYALRYYGLIPESVYTVTSASFNKRKTKNYQTLFGNFTFRDVPSRVFPYEIRIVKEGAYYFKIASPEKALCDFLYTVKPVNNAKELYELLTDYYRMNPEDLRLLNLDIIEELAPLYHSTIMKKLITLLMRLKK